MKDLHSFLTEEDRKKKEEAKKPHAVKEGEGADDKEYLAIMTEYKQLRRKTLFVPPNSGKLKA